MPLGDDLSVRNTGDLITTAIYNEIIASVNFVLRGNMVGAIQANFRTTNIDEHWLLCNGNTIGASASGATARANADMALLYGLLWGATTNAILIIQNSAGTDTTRGLTATADFNANKRLPLPDLRGRTIIGIDGTADRIADAWANDLGGFGGLSTHTLTVAQMPSHSHVGTFSGSINFAVAGGVGAASGSGYSNDSIGATGGSASHPNVQPSMALSYLICTGV